MAASLVPGRITDRFGARPAVICGALAMGAGCLALGIALTAACAGGAVMPPLPAWLSARYGFGPAMAGIGAAPVLSVLPVAVFLVRPPKSGEAAREPVPTAAASGPKATSAQRIFGTVRFRIVATAFSLSLGAQVGFLMHQVRLLQGALGLSGAAFAVSVAALGAGPGRFALGALGTRSPLPVPAAGCCLIQASGLLLLAGEPPALPFAGSAIAGFVVGCIVMLPPLLLADRFGQDGYGAAYGVTAAGMFIMAGLVTAAGGRLFDATGARDLPLPGLAGLHLPAGLLIPWHGRWQRTGDVAR